MADAADGRFRVRTVDDRRSAVWGGATLGLFVGLILGFFVGSSYWRTVLIAVGIGAASGIVANILGWIGDRARRKRQERVSLSRSPSTVQMMLGNVEGVLREHSAAEFQTTENAAYEAVYVVSLAVKDEDWRAGYDSLESFYAAHEARHPDIRVYAAVAQSFPEDSDPATWPSDVIVQRIAQLARDRSSAD
jgi:hypothetical protein